jgi:IPT/TIG domain
MGAGQSPSSSTPSHRPRDNEPPGRRPKAIVASLAVLALAAAGLASVGTASAATVTGTLVTNSLTRPGGGAFLPGGGGHFWVSDGVLGLCETVPATLAVTKCNGAAKGGQVDFDSAKSFVYQADSTTKTNQVMRLAYTAATDGLGASTTLQVPNLTAVGGGSGGGRAMGIARATGPDGAERLYVSYIKSGDIMQVLNPSGKDKNGAVVAPTVSKVGNTSDGRGANALTVFTWTDAAGVKHDDLYVAETGGFGLSVIRDVDGTGGRPACNSASPCGATTVINAAGSALFSFPGGLANDGKVITLGDAPLNTVARVLTWNPLSNTQSVLSTDISPAYTSGFDGVNRTQYKNITGIAINPATLDAYVGDDPSFPLLTPVTAQGHLWKVPGNALQPVVTGVAPATGDVAGGTVVTITGTNLVNTVVGAADPLAYGTTVKFGTLAATNVSCLPDGTSCTATTAKATGAGIVDVRVTNAELQTSTAVAGDQFSYTVAAAVAGAPAVSSITPTTGLSVGGTSVLITGTALVNPDGSNTVSFGTNPAASTNCTPDGLTCTVASPAGTDGSSVDVQVTTLIGTSPAVAGDKFTYVSPVGALYSSGITAPKGGVTWIPDTTTPAAGHYWVSDHGNGLCRMDPMPGTTIFAPNVSFCDPGFTIGSPGQAVYDPRVNADGTHWVYVPDNAVKSPGVWRLTFHPATATIDTPVAMAPGLMANLKTNSMALDPVKDVAYVGDLVDGNIRRINGIGGDPRLQSVDIIAQTQAQKVGGVAVGRGINGTMALLGNRLYLPENNAATFVDVTAACANPLVNPNPAPCATTTVNFLTSAVPVFVAGIATDATHGLVYISASPGAANAVIYRFDASTITAANPGGTPAVVYVTGGKVPAAGTPEATVYCTTTCTRPVDPALTPGGTTGFPFAQGLYVDPNNSALFVTEDASAGARSGRGHAWVVPFTP